MSIPDSFNLSPSKSAFDMSVLDGLTPALAQAALTPAQKQEIPQLAEELALFGATNTDQILELYGYTPAQFTQLVEPNAVFKAATALITAQLQDDPHLAERRKSKAMFSKNMAVLTQIAQDPRAENKDKINAMKLLADVADIGPRKQKEEKSDGGPQVHINFGATLGAKLHASMQTVR